LTNNADGNGNLRYQTSREQSGFKGSKKSKVSKFKEVLVQDSKKKFKDQEKRLADPAQIGRAIRSVIIIELIDLVASNFTDSGAGRQAEARRQQLVSSNS
jgi:hypothetical protein